jgi:hypothetical protein
MRTPPLLLAFLVVAGVAAAPKPAHAGLGLGLFVGEPTAFTVKVDLQRRTALEVALGIESIRNDGRGAYGHFTFLASPFVAHGESVIVPFRIGIGAAVWDDDAGPFGDDIGVGVRAPFEIAFQFRRSPVEIYLEIALKLQLVDPNDNDPSFDADGGIGFRIYF